MSQSQNQPGIGDMIVGAVKHNPEALLLLAAGCALMMRSTPSSGATRQAVSDAGDSMARAGDSARQYASGVAEQARQYTSDVAGQARRYTSDVADQARETIGSYASAASNYAEQTRRTIGDQSQQIIQQSQSVLQGTLDRMLRDQPLAVAFAGLAAGAALAAAFPATQAEKDTLGPVGERAVAAAATMGDRLKDAASEATDTLKQSAERRGLTAENVKEVASEVAGAFSDRMAGGSRPGSSGAGGGLAGA